MAAFSPFFALSTFRTLSPPLDVNEEGRDRFGLETELRAGEVLPRRLLRERVVEGVSGLDSPLDSGTVRSSSSGTGSVSDASPLLPGRIDSDFAEDGREVIGVSGTGASAPPAGGAGGGRSGPSMPPTLGTPGSAARMRSTSSSVVMMNWTNEQKDHWSLPKTSASRMRPPPVGW